MSSPRPDHTFDFDNEPRDIHVDPASLPRIVEEEDCEEEYESDLSEDESMEENPREGEPEESHPVPPTTQSERIPPFTLVRRNPNGPFIISTSRMSVRAPQTTSFPIPTNDPHLPPPPSTSPHQWGWMRATLRRWRNKDSNPFTMIAESPTQAQTPACPVLGEPPHHTIPLLIERLDSQETDIETLRDNLEALPSSGDYQGMKADSEFLWRNFKKLRIEVDQLENKVSDINLEEGRRLNDIDHNLDQLRCLVDGLYENIAHIYKELSDIQKKN